LHPSVAWVRRINSGAAFIKGQFVSFGFTGCADILGQMTRSFGGAFLAVETKAPDGELTGPQESFLTDVARAGGFAAAVNNVADLDRAMNDWRRGWTGTAGSSGEPYVMVSRARQVTPRARKRSNSSRSNPSSPGGVPPRRRGEKKPGTGAG
jgi:hypothetical protein